MKVAVTPDLEKIIESELQNGRFQNAEEFLKVAVQHYIVARDLGETYTREEEEQMTAHLEDLGYL